MGLEAGNKKEFKGELRKFLTEALKKNSQLEIDDILLDSSLLIKLDVIAKTFQMTIEEILGELRVLNPDHASFEMPRVDGGMSTQGFHIEGDRERAVRFK